MIAFVIFLLACLTQASSTSISHLRERFERAIAADINDAAAHFKLGCLLNQIEEFKSARAHYEKSIAIDTNNAEAHYELGILLKKHFKDFKGARDHYGACITIDPNHARAHYNLGDLLRTHFKDFKGAYGHCMKSNEINPNSAETHYDLGALLDEHFKDFNGARNHYERSISLNPNHPFPHCSLGVILKSHFKDFQGALQHYEKAIEIHPSYVKAHYNLAILLEEHFKDFNGARKHYERSISLNPNHAEAHCNLANLLMQYFKDFKRARKHYEFSIAIDPNDAQVHSNLAVLLKKYYHDSDGAREHYQISIEIDRNNAATYFNLGNLLNSHFKDFNGAYTHYKQSIAIHPSGAHTHRCLGSLLKDHFKDFDGAREHFMRARDIDPKGLQANFEFLDEETNCKILRSSPSARLIDEAHFRHHFYNELTRIREPSKPSDERTQFIRPLLCVDITSNFQSLALTLHKSEYCFQAWAKCWLSFYISICSNSYTTDDFRNQVKKEGLEVRHLVSLLEIANELRIFLIDRDNNKGKVLLDISMDNELMEKIGILSIKLYTMERESGGPYYDINVAFQEDRVEGVFELNINSCYQPTIIVSFGFHLLYTYFRGKYGLPERKYTSCWRGMKELTEAQWKLFQINSEFYWPSFVSTSLNPSVAEKFCRLDFENDVEVGPNSVLFKIYLPGHAFALSLAKISALAEENEVLLFPYHKFRVVKGPPKATEKSAFKGRGIVYLDCVGCELSPED